MDSCFGKFLCHIKIIISMVKKFIQGSVDITQIKNNKMYVTLIGKNGKPLPGFD